MYNPQRDMVNYSDVNIWFLGLAVLLIVELIWLIRMEVRITRLLKGKKAVSLESHINQALSDLDNLKLETTQITETIETIKRKVRTNIGPIKTIRFNPFKDSGGDQSFATALIDSEGNGLIISSLYSRDRVSVFAKPLERFKSKYELTAEESKALTSAKKERGPLI